MAGKLDIARALKDRAYFDSLSEEEKQLVRDAGPVGEVDLSDEDLASASGGAAEGALGSGSGSGSGVAGAIEATTCHCHCHCNPKSET